MTESMTSREEKKFGEVVEASTTGFVVQCYRLYGAPPLGSLVGCGGEAGVYGVVCQIENRSMDPARHPIPRGAGEVSEEAVYLSNPQLERLLCTELQCAIVGYRDDGEIKREPSLLPPRIHSFVYRCDASGLREFSSSLDFLPTLLEARAVGVRDDVIAAFLRQASLAHPEPRRLLVDAGRELAVLLGGSLPRLNGLLKRLAG